MRSKPLAVIGAVVVAFGLGFLVSGSMGAPGADEESVSPMDGIPVALQRMWFQPASEYDTEGEALDDELFDGLMADLEVALTAEETLADFEAEAEMHLWGFVRRLAIPELSEEQKERAKAYMEELAERHPDHSRMIEQNGSLLESYAAAMPSAPGATFRLMFFGDAEEFDNEGGPFEDAQIDRLIAKMEAVLALPEVATDIEEEAGIAFWRFGNRLQLGQVSEEQTARIVAFLDGVKEEHPDAAEFIDRQKFLAKHLTPGNVAPNIVGTDTEGVEFALEDYRGKIVAVIFSGQWCGPCRGEYPYQRAMLDIYEEDDVVLLGVNSDAELQTIVDAKVEEELHYRTWWDGHSQPDADVVAAEGPIATEWGVRGWPTIYLLDGEGVIRHVDKRGGGLIAAVDDLLMEKRMAEYEAQMAEAEAAAADGEAEAEDAEGDTDTPESEDDGEGETEAEGKKKTKIGDGNG